MDYCLERRPPPLVPPQQRQTSGHPSFSATLLDAIYRSLDGSTPETERTAMKHSKPRPELDPLPQKKKSHSDFWWASTKRKPAPPSYTSSDTSSYGFSSDVELSQTKPAKVNRVQFHPPAALPPKSPPQENKKKSNPFRKRWRELRKGRTCANSKSIGASGTRGGSGSPLSNFLKAIFSSSRTQKKKKNIMSMSTAPQQGGVDVPVLEPVPHPEEMSKDVDMEAEAVKRRVDEILRALEKEKQEEGEGDGEEENDSDGSSDLFELENLTAIGSDELPVYCTTSLVANHPAIKNGTSPEYN